VRGRTSPTIEERRKLEKRRKRSKEEHLLLLFTLEKTGGRRGYSMRNHAQGHLVTKIKETPRRN